MLGMRENAMNASPITDKIIADADACPETRIVFLIKNLANKCNEFERLYNAALICAGVASKERGEWAVERDALLIDKDEYCKVLSVLGMEEDGSPVEEIREREKITDELRELLRIEYLRHGAIETPWICVEADCPRSGKSVFVTGCNCKLDFEMRHIAAVKKELGL